MTWLSLFPPLLTDLENVSGKELNSWAYILTKEFVIKVKMDFGLYAYILIKICYKNVKSLFSCVIDRIGRIYIF